MTLSETLWQQVRQRAEGACEYCGVTETDSGGPLTVDHFQPQARGNGPRRIGVSQLRLIGFHSAGW